MDNIRRALERDREIEASLYPGPWNANCDATHGALISGTPWHGDIAHLMSEIDGEAHNNARGICHLRNTHAELRAVVEAAEELRVIITNIGWRNLDISFNDRPTATVDLLERLEPALAAYARKVEEQG